MKLTIKQYKVQRVEVGSKEIELPSETSYFFETGVRRSIRIVPSFTTWNQEKFNKQEEIYEFHITCVYLSFECRVEKFSLTPEKIEEIYYSQKQKHEDFVTGLVDGWFDERTKEQFESDLNNAIKAFKSE